MPEGSESLVLDTGLSHSLLVNSGLAVNWTTTGSTSNFLSCFRYQPAVWRVGASGSHATLLLERALDVISLDHSIIGIQPWPMRPITLANTN